MGKRGLKRIDALIWEDANRDVEISFVNPDGSPQDLTGYLPKLLLHKSDGTFLAGPVSHDPGQSNLPGGIVVFVLTSSITATPMYDVEGTIYNNSISSVMTRVVFDILARPTATS